MTINGTKLKERSIGMTLSHYEFDVDLLNDEGKIQHVPVKNVGTMHDVLSGLNVLRFMNWQKTNVNPIWNAGQEREFHVPPTTLDEFLAWEADKSWRFPPVKKGSLRGKWSFSHGVPLHICLRVAKDTQAHPWICIPHGETREAFDLLMRGIVDMTIDALTGTGLTPIFEYSNEVWNGGRFRQQLEIANVRAGGCASDRPEPLPDGIWDKLKNNEPLTEWEAQCKQEHDERSGKNRLAALKHQIRCTNEIKAYVQDRGLVVIGAQCNDPSVAQRLLFDADEPLSADVDALAIAPYYGPMRQVMANWPLAEILPRGFHPLIDLCDGRWINPDADDALEKLYRNLRYYVCGAHDQHGKQVGGEIRRAFVKHRELVDQFNTKNQRSKPLQLFTYEGGLDLRYQADYFRERRDGLLQLSAEFAAMMTQDKVTDLYHRFHHDERAGQLIDDVLNLWHSDEVRGDLFVGYSSATQYCKAHDKNSGDFFGYIDLVDTPAYNDRYVGTHKLRRLLAHTP